MNHDLTSFFTINNLKYSVDAHKILFEIQNLWLTPYLLNKAFAQDKNTHDFGTLYMILNILIFERLP